MQNEIFNQTVNQINFDNNVRIQHEQHRQFVSNSVVSKSNSLTALELEYLKYTAHIEAVRARIKEGR